MAYLVTSSGFGGAEHEVCLLAEEFRRRHWAVAVISMLPLEAPVANLTRAGVRTFSLEMQRRVADPRALLRLGRILRRSRPDVLHAHMVHANLLARASRLLTPTPVLISTIHNENEGAQWRYLGYRWTNRLSDFTTAVSRTAAEEAIRRGAAPPGSIVVVPNGLRTAAYRDDPRARDRTRLSLDLGSSFTWLAVGRLVDAKGYGDMIAAFAVAQRTHPDAKLLIVGAGPLEADIRRLASQTILGGAVRLLGLRTDVPDLMSAADGFVMTSHWEGLPMVLLEAGASALPVIATDVGGSRDAVVDGVSGHLTPVRDPAATARAMISIMARHGDDRRAMGEAGRDHIRASFEIEVVADVWERMYRRSAPKQ